MSDDRSAHEAILADLDVLARRAAEAKSDERVALEERECAVVDAVRAGARLDEIGTAAGLTKAGASAIARKTLGARSGRGGPYRRRRGVEAALSRVQEAAGRATAATRRRRRAIGERDRAIVATVDAGLPARAIAEVLGMDIKVVYTLIRRRRAEAMTKLHGTFASPIASEESADTIV